MHPHRPSTQQTQKLAAALAKAAREHGVPNNFFPVELCTYYGAPQPMVQGNVARTGLAGLQEKLQALEPGLTLTYTAQGRRPKTPASFAVAGTLADTVAEPRR
jgi:hypothetical protein